MKDLSSTAGVKGGRPYFIDDFISKRNKIKTRQSKLKEIYEQSKIQQKSDAEILKEYSLDDINKISDKKEKTETDAEILKRFDEAMYNKMKKEEKTEVSEAV